MSNYTNTY